MSEDIKEIDFDKLISDYYYNESENNSTYALEELIKVIVDKQNEIINKITSTKGKGAKA